MGMRENGIINDASNADAGIRFELQAIARADNLSVYGYEFLYRGKVWPGSVAEWMAVDRAVLRYLAQVDEGGGKPCFINLSHESVLTTEETAFAAACARNDIRFEMSEAAAEKLLFDQVCEKVNRLSSLGMQFAIDDFGAGLDGSRRLYALDSVAAIKVDRGLLMSAADRPQAARMLEASVASWKSAGITTVAEGVESAELLAFAQRVGFELLQGWHVDTIVPPKQAFISRAFF
ncbi:EAL domain-containing protein [Massilia jejuensis]|uniref:EAL domain-containing protein n=1 Tax=Massilia jejuensis TaxID=648894 RepID=A0ABW0PGK8_9BURK